MSGARKMRRKGGRSQNKELSPFGACSERFKAKNTWFSAFGGQTVLEFERLPIMLTVPELISSSAAAKTVATLQDYAVGRKGRI